MYNLLLGITLEAESLFFSALLNEVWDNLFFLQSPTTSSFPLLAKSFLEHFCSGAIKNRDNRERWNQKEGGWLLWLEKSELPLGSQAPGRLERRLYLGCAGGWEAGHVLTRNPVLSKADPTAWAAGKGGILDSAELYLGKTRHINCPETLELSIQSDPKLCEDTVL